MFNPKPKGRVGLWSLCLPSWDPESLEIIGSSQNPWKKNNKNNLMKHRKHMEAFNKQCHQTATGHDRLNCGTSFTCPADATTWALAKQHWEHADIPTWRIHGNGLTMSDQSDWKTCETIVTRFIRKYWQCRIREYWKCRRYIEPCKAGHFSLLVKFHPWNRVFQPFFGLYFVDLLTHISSNASNSFFPHVVHPTPGVLCYATFDVFHPWIYTALRVVCTRMSLNHQFNCSNSTGTIVVRKFEVNNFVLVGVKGEGPWCLQPIQSISKHDQIAANHMFSTFFNSLHV